MATRDPYRDPQPGDVFRSGDGAEPVVDFHVTGTDETGGLVFYQESAPGEDPAGPMLRYSLDEWAAVAENDILIRTAESLAAASVGGGRP